MAAPVLLALLASFQFAGALVLTQFALRHAAPAQGARISIPAAATILALAGLFSIDPAPANLPAILVFAAVGLVFPVAVTRLTFEANRRMGPSIAGALGNLAPLFAVGGAMLVLAEMPGPLQAAGLLAVIAGAAVLSLAQGGGQGRFPPAIILLPLAAAAIRGAVQPATKFGLALWPSPLAAAAIGYAVSAAVVLALPAPPGRPTLPARLWFAAVGLCNGGAVLTLYAALREGPVVLVAPLVATYPLVTMALSALLLRGSRLSAPVAAGIVLTVAGVALLLAG